MWNASTITRAGTALLSGWITGKSLNISAAEGGTGTIPASGLEYMTSLSSKKQDASIIGLERDNKSATVKVQFSAATEAYTLNQIGIYAHLDNDDTVLLAVFQDDNGVAIPEATTGREFLYTVFLMLAIDNTGTIHVAVDPSAYVSMGTLENALNNYQPKITASGILKGNGAGGVSAAAAGTDYVGINDSRLSDARTPTSHKDTHKTGGADAITPADIGAAASDHNHTKSDVGLGNVANERQYSANNPPPTDTTRQSKITVSGILKGNGSGGVSAAAAGTDYPDIKMARNISVSSWAADNTYADYPYRASVPITGVTADYIPSVAFGLTEAKNGKYAPIAESYAGGVYLYAKVNTAITVPSIVCQKGV